MCIRSQPLSLVGSGRAYVFLILLALPTSAAAKSTIVLQDAIVDTDRKTRLVAYVSRENLFGVPTDIEHAPVTFHAGSHELGATTTDDEGMAVLECTLPEGDIRKIEARAKVGSKELRTEAAVHRWREDRIIIVVDIDDTISRTDLDDLLFDEKDDDSRPLKHSPRVLRHLSKDYQILYLTARPSFLLEKTRQWLEENDFPAAPVLVSHQKRDLLRQGVYKRRVLEGLQKTWPLVLIGIGDRGTDAEAYGGSRMLCLIVNPNRKDRFGRHVLMLPDWKAIDVFFATNRIILSDPERLRRVIAGQEPFLHTLSPHDDTGK